MAKRGTVKTDKDGGVYIISGKQKIFVGARLPNGRIFDPNSGASLRFQYPDGPIVDWDMKLYGYRIRK